MRIGEYKTVNDKSIFGRVIRYVYTTKFPIDLLG